MAVLPHFPGVVVSITTNGQTFYEHQDNNNHDLPGTITKYIEASTGTTFAVDIAVAPHAQFQSDCLSFEVCVDGQAITASSISLAQLGHGGQRWMMYGDYMLGTVRPMKFSALRIADNEDHAINIHGGARIANTGVITVNVWHGTRTHPVDPHSIAPSCFSSLGAVSEQMLKGRTLSHSVDLGAPIQVNHSQTYFDVAYVGGYGSHAGVFNFRYLSKESLQALNIILRTPAPAAVPIPAVPLHQRNPQELSREELIQVVQHLQHYKNAVKRMNEGLPGA